MKIKNNILETIGNTPMIKLNKIVSGISAEVFAKVEYFNPGNSVKDRMAIKISNQYRAYYVADKERTFLKNLFFLILTGVRFGSSKARANLSGIVTFECCN